MRQSPSGLAPDRRDQHVRHTTPPCYRRACSHSTMSGSESSSFFRWELRSWFFPKMANRFATPCAASLSSCVRVAIVSLPWQSGRCGGATWENLPVQPDDGVITMATSAADPKILYVGTPTGLPGSVDAGATWVNLGPDGIPVLALAAAPNDPSRVLFVTDGGGVYRSDDGGRTWRMP